MFDQHWELCIHVYKTATISEELKLTICYSRRKCQETVQMPWLPPTVYVLYGHEKCQQLWMEPLTKRAVWYSELLCIRWPMNKIGLSFLVSVIDFWSVTSLSAKLHEPIGYSTTGCTEVSLVGEGYNIWFNFHGLVILSQYKQWVGLWLECFAHFHCSKCRR